MVTNETMSIFENYEMELIGTDIVNPEFNKKSKVHDWRNYVPNDFQENWNKLTERERKIIVVMAQLRANEEEWD